MESSGTKNIILGIIAWMFVVLDFGSCSRNVALHKPAWMSSTYAKNNASRAVDGKKSPTGKFTGCHTALGDKSPWLIVDLLGQYHVTSITIYNRWDCCGFRLHDFILEIFKTNPTGQASTRSFVCKKYTGVFGLVGTVVCDKPVLGRYVRIWKPRTNSVLNFDELEVYAQECTPIPIPVLDGIRVMSNNTWSVPASSRLECVTKCEMFGICCGVNYNKASRACELLPCSELNEVFTSDPNWAYYRYELCEEE